MKFRGRVDGAGTFRLERGQAEAYRALFVSFAGKDVEVTVEPAGDPHTTSARRFYFGCVIPPVREYLSRGRVLPLTKDSVHFVLKSAFIGTEDTPLGPVPKSTKGMPLEKFLDFVTAVQAHFAQLGVEFPEVGE